MIDERTEELATAYAIGALDAEDARLFEREMQADAALRALVAELRGVSEMLAGSSPLVQPAAALRSQLLIELGDRRQLRPVTRRGYPAWLPWGLAAGFAALCVVFGWQSRTLHRELDAQQRRVVELSALADTLRSERADLRQAVLQLQQSNALANMRIAVLSSQLKSDPQAVAVSVWDNQRQAGVVVVHHLKPPPKDKDYQLWIIDPRYPTPVDAGVMKVDAQGDGRVDFTAHQPIQNASQFAVTEEIKGGSPVPTPNALVLAGA